MACTFPQELFNENLNLNVSLNVSGTTATLSLQNHGQNILQLTRILLGVTYPGGSATVLYLRPPGMPITWSYPGATLEQGLVSRERVILNSGYGSRTMVHGIDCGCGGSAAGS